MEHKKEWSEIVNDNYERLESEIAEAARTFAQSGKHSKLSLELDRWGNITGFWSGGNNYTSYDILQGDAMIVWSMGGDGWDYDIYDEAWADEYEPSEYLDELIQSLAYEEENNRAM